jgi:hypothetical protein
MAYIVLVEDNEDVADLMCHALRAEGHRCFVIRSKAGAERFFRRVRRAARVGNAAKSVCDGTRKGRDGRGGDCRRLGAPGDSAAARSGIERSLRARADQLAEDPGFAGGHARLETAGANNGEAEGGTRPKAAR